MKKIQTRVFLILLLLAFTTIACRLNIGGPKPDQEILVSPDSADQIIENLNSVSENTLEGGPFALTFTQDQLTSYLAYEVDTSAYGITNPKVLLEDGQIVVYGQLEQNLITADIKLILKPYIDPSGVLNMDLASVDLGPIPAPDSLLSSLSNTIDQSLQQAFVEIPDGYQITSIEIVDGVMTISAQKF